MRNIIKTIFISATLIFSLLIMTSCADDEPAVVNFNGGILSGYNAEMTLTEVSTGIPEKEGYVFAGWYSDGRFTNYISPGSPSKEQIKIGTAYAKWIESPETVTYTVRTEEKKVTDSGPAKNHMDAISLKNDFNIQDLKRAGYSKFKVEVTLDVCEVNDGYQYVMFYKNTECKGITLDSLMDEYIFGIENEDPSNIYTYKMENDSNWKTVTFSADTYLSSIGDSLYMRYDASGKGDDDWLNKNVFVKITVE